VGSAASRSRGKKKAFIRLHVDSNVMVLGKTKVPFQRRDAENAEISAENTSREDQEQDARQ
jgi:hypothetical protein